MINQNNSVFFFFNLCLVFALHNASSHNERKPYVVYMGALPAGGSKVSLSAVHDNILFQAIGDERIAAQSKIHSYGRSFNALAAWLLPHEAKTLSERRGVVSVFQSIKRKLHTTHSWDFLGMPTTVKRNLQVESDIIVGLIDSGIYVDLPSFNDKGIGRPPAKWKGRCQTGLNFTRCNNKVIGAQAFNLLDNDNQSSSPADFEGHGTHTASTVAGSLHRGASLYGLLNGTARGGVPAARIAMYKACNEVGCADVDILAAFDAAIADGVDILSVSLGGYPASYNEDPVAIGSFHAMQKGILTSCSAGNEGDRGVGGTVTNVAPWIFTVAAASTDRHLVTEVELGDGRKFPGISLSLFKSSSFPLTSGTLASLLHDGSGRNCDEGTLEESKVKAKVLYCVTQNRQDDIIEDMGAKGIIMSDEGPVQNAFPFRIPASVVKFPEIGDKIEAYINSTRQPTAVIHRTKIVKVNGSFMASFSSRGPQYIAPNLLKPDISAPGLNILAGFSPLTSISGDIDDTRTSVYNVFPGTSMSCPHVSAAAAYVKSFHSDWSPAAIKSALMTTAKPLGVKDVDVELAYGAGMINPTTATNPGLVFDIDEAAYINFLCKIGYNSSNLRQITGNATKDCSRILDTNGEDGLNYPTINLNLNTVSNNPKIDGVFHRTVTNVGKASAVYKATVKALKGLSIEVSPNVLSFDSKKEKKSFQVSLKGNYPDKETMYLSGSIIWSDSIHNVRIPVLVSRPAGSTGQ
ncbi:PREDICTED: subtilisin-like protease SBT4.15 [Ipomoea nil]|uniref:subtilisin-like protease SBT4.15 n=1 Tax=Ipomoea nil TaxID=35883 RepID=UPI00090135D9|nr:PREDICTED: subtilisin-like protease SBT4.15 [Ipomoea nil]